MRRARVLLIKRAIFLLAVGLLHINIWIADILHYYGIYLLVAAVLLSASGAWLWGLVLVCTFICPWRLGAGRP